MANATRASKLQGLHHFVYTLLDIPPNDSSTGGDVDHPVTRYLEATGVASAPQLAVAATEDNLNSTVLHDTAGVDITGTITLMTRQRILALKAWISAQSVPTNCHVELMNLTYDTFEDFVLADALDKMHFRNAYAPVHVAPTPAPVAPPTSAEIFDRGLKRSVIDYKEFRERKHFNSWLRIFRATACVQDVDIVLDPNYAPLSTGERVFLSGNSAMFSKPSRRHCSNHLPPKFFDGTLT
jgi:hypothetical protein